jgi:hypothetical protein
MISSEGEPPMPEFVFKNGKTVQWEAINNYVGFFAGNDVPYCRFCLESNIGPGIIVGSICSNNCEGNRKFIEEYYSKNPGKKKIEIAPEVVIKEVGLKEKNEMIKYDHHPRSPFQAGTLADRIFSKIANNPGITRSSAVEMLQAENDTVGIIPSFQSKISAWSKSDHSLSNVFILVLSDIFSAGRPRAEDRERTANQRLQIVFEGEELPEWVHESFKK